MDYEGCVRKDLVEDDYLLQLELQNWSQSSDTKKWLQTAIIYGEFEQNDAPHDDKTLFLLYF